MSDSEATTRLRAWTDSTRASHARDEDVIDERVPCFGWLRGMRETSPMLELRKKSGSILAVGYGWLERIEFDPSEGIFLDVEDQRIVIRGRNLNAEVRVGIRLFEGLTRHRVPWIREVSSAEAMTAPAELCVVEAIEW